MAIDWNAFAGGMAKSYANNIDTRAREERELKMRETLAALEEKHGIAREERAAKREDAKLKKKVDENRSGYDYETGEMVFRNQDGEEIGRKSDPTMAEDRAWTKEERALKRRQVEASIGASNRSGRGGGGGAGLDSVGQKNRSRVETVLNNIDSRLEEIGAPANERLAARQAVLKKVASGQDIDQGWLDRYESNLITGYQKQNKLDQWGVEKIKREAAKAALSE